MEPKDSLISDPMARPTPKDARMLAWEKVEETKMEKCSISDSIGLRHCALTRAKQMVVLNPRKTIEIDAITDMEAPTALSPRVIIAAV